MNKHEQLIQLLRATLPALYEARRHAITTQRMTQLDNLIKRVEKEV